jgi:hypothetical protein
MTNDEQLNAVLIENDELKEENAKLKEEVERIMFILRMRTRAVSASAMTAFPPLPKAQSSETQMTNN